MKKLFKTGLILFIVGLVAAGAALGMGAYKKSEWTNAAKKIRDLKGFYPQPVAGFAEFEQEDITDIKIDFFSKNIKVITTNEYEKVTLKYYDDYYNNFSVKSEDGLLLIKEEKPKDSHVFMYVNIVPEELLFPDAKKFYIYLPAGMTLNTLNATGSSGNITIDGVRVSSYSEVKVNSGNITVSDSTFDDCYFKASSGNLKLSNCAYADVVVSASSGNITISAGQANGLRATVSSGNITILSTAAITMTASASSGNVKISGVDFDKTSVTASVSSGNKKINGKSTGEYVAPNPLYTIKASAKSGNVTVS